jgi:hypothetical protein
MKTAFVSFAMLFGVSAVVAGEWPTYRHDERRSGVSDEMPEFPLTELWVRESRHEPQMAWTGPAKWDAFSGNSGLQSMRNFDPCFYVTVAGGQVFFGSSVDDAVHALDAATGVEQWVFFTGAPVRFPPALWKGRAYAGSDDGNVYCLDQTKGTIIWKKRAAPMDRLVPSNRKLISTHPVRTGVLVLAERAYFGASLVPWEESVLWCVDAASGTPDYRQELDGVTLQGALLASPTKLYVPQGRAAPLTFDRADGSFRGMIKEAGGVFCVLTEDEMLLTGPQNQKAPDNQVRVADVETKRRLATFGGTERVLVSGNRAWMHVGERLKMLDRPAYLKAQRAIDAAANSDEKQQENLALREATAARTAAWTWSLRSEKLHTMILAGKALFVGLDEEVRAIDSDTGELLWKAEVEGTAHGLAFAEGRLFVSTGLGHIYAFGR